MHDTIRVRIWHGRYDDYPNEPDEVLELPAEQNVVWQDDPWYDSGSIAFDVHPEDTPATVFIYTNDSVREPHKDDLGEWDGPIERGLEFDADRYADYPPYGCEVWGRILMRAEGGFTA